MRALIFHVSGPRSKSGDWNTGRPLPLACCTTNVSAPSTRAADSQGSAGVDTDDAGLTMHPERPRGCPALCLGLRAETVEESQDACEAIGE